MDPETLIHIADLALEQAETPEEAEAIVKAALEEAGGRGMRESEDAQGHEHGEHGRFAPKGQGSASADEPDDSQPFATPEQMMAKAKDVRPRQITPVNTTGHSAPSKKLVDTIAQSMEEDGWKGPPLLAMKREDQWQGLTGSHRLAAAEKAGLDAVPVVFVDHDDVLKWAEKAGYDLPPDADLTDLEDEDRWKILAQSDNPVAKEIMRLEWTRGGGRG